jgi:hypothetical protein
VRSLLAPEEQNGLKGMVLQLLCLQWRDTEAQQQFGSSSSKANVTVLTHGTVPCSLGGYISGSVRSSIPMGPNQSALPRGGGGSVAMAGPPQMDQNLFLHSVG